MVVQMLFIWHLGFLQQGSRSTLISQDSTLSAPCSSLEPEEVGLLLHGFKLRARKHLTSLPFYLQLL